MKVYLSQRQVRSCGEVLYVVRRGGPRRRVWAHVEVHFPCGQRGSADWDFFLLPGERLPLVPLARYEGWSIARLTLPDGEENFALETRTYIENHCCGNS